MILVGTFLFVTAAHASTNEKFFQVTKVSMQEVSADLLTPEKIDELYRKDFRVTDLPTNGNPGALNTASRVISVAKDLVALGEDIYRLVIKGKPTNKTTYAPISVVPLENGAPVDIMSTEYWKTPVMRTYEVKYENLYGIEVVNFKYSVIFSYGGSYHGKGQYLTAVQIVPEYVRTLFGFDFSATMKLGGIQNSGSRENPVAGATLLLESTINSVMVADTSVYVFHVSGNGDFTAYQR